MVDFKSLVGTKRDIEQYDLEELFSSLDVKGTHTEPRAAQREAMQELTKRHEEKDLILKISTGAGKTTVGLLYLLGHMKLTRLPTVYLCPTVQLIKQVLDEAEKLGISAYEYPTGQKHPDPSCVRGDSITVCTYEKLFNAKSSFVTASIFPQAIVFDDAHAGIEVIRKQYTLSIQGDAYHKLLGILDSSCSAYDRSVWRDIQSAEPTQLLEVPHWIWTDHLREVEEMLYEYRDDDNFKFVWPSLQTILVNCRCVIAGSSAEIAPEVLPTNFVRPFVQTKHRLYMSATLADDSLLTRELGVLPESAQSPITPPSDRGLGERMILAPSLVEPNMDRDYVIELSKELCKSHNVVVLTSSASLAKDWEAAGAQFFVGDTFLDGVNQLRSSDSELNFAVFAQRYDGVDLPDDACRVLVLDGVPYGAGLMDKQDQHMALMPGGVRNKTIFRIEQGMGRPVRSHADFAVVLLSGEDLTTYVGRRDVLDSMTPDTRNQLQLSIELAELIHKEDPENPITTVRKVIDQCLDRDEGWKSYYNEKVRKVASNAPNIDQVKIVLAHEERNAYISAMNNMVSDAIGTFEKAIYSSGIEGDELAVYLQRLSRITYQVDTVQAMSFQQKARRMGVSASLPPDMPRKPPMPTAKSVPDNYLSWFNKFSNSMAAIIESQKISDSLNLNAKHKFVEEAIKLLGEALGALSIRPEKDFNQGPDNLWIWGEIVLVIEVKNEKTSVLNKSDSGQLHDSLQWAKENYPMHAEKIKPLTVSKGSLSSKDSHYSPDTRVLTEDGCRRAGFALQQLCKKMVRTIPVMRVPQTVLEEMGRLNLTPEQFLATFTEKIQSE